MSDRIFIRDLAPAQLVEGVFSLQNCQLGHTKSGKPYIRCLLGDATGRTPGRLWNATEDMFQVLPTDGFVWIQGETQPYQGEMQIIMRTMREHDPSVDELRDLLPSTTQDVNKMFREVMQLLQSIQHPPLKALADRYLEDGELMDKFCQAPAAQMLHHAYLGGLLEHTLSVMRLAECVLPLYPRLNRDVVLIGLFVHDLGKCAELTWKRGLGYSTDGQLVGHIARGMLWLEEKAKLCEAEGVKIPAPLLGVLHHIILSHHGQPEFGALKYPATPEALAVSLIDNMDAKLNMGLTAARGDDGQMAEDRGGPFTEKVWSLNNVRMYRPDPTLLADDPLGGNDE